jgi:hypothetical protein
VKLCWHRTEKTHENSRRRMTGVVEEAGRSAIWGWRWWGTAFALVRIDANPLLHYTVTTWQIHSQVRPSFEELFSKTRYRKEMMLTTHQEK